MCKTPVPLNSALGTSAATTSPLECFQCYKFTLPRPILAITDEARPHRVFLHVLPFFGITFGMTDQVVEKNPFCQCSGAPTIPSERCRLSSRTHSESRTLELCRTTTWMCAGM